MRLAAIAAATALLAGVPAWGLELARDGRALAPIRVGSNAADVERRAARELADYLERITGAPFTVETGDSPGPSIEVGWTDAVLAAGLEVSSLGEEDWVVRTVDDRLWLTGGAPRGVLYAVYRFLEDDLGVRWWTPWDETVPRRVRLKVGALDRAGTPVFAYRDIFDVRGAPEFHARNRLNGHYSGLPVDWGGSLRFGPPFHTHTFDRRVPVATHFEDHPEFFSEVGGLRYGGQTQWCLTNEALLDVAEADVRASIREGEHDAERLGLSPPLYYDVSQNDWANPCGCERCATVAREEGSQSGPVIRFVDRLAERIARDRPDLALTTLAYQYSAGPPRKARAGEALIVRYTDLFQRDFAKPLGAPSNAVARAAIDGWVEHAEHLHVWDYRVTFHADGDLPRADHAFVAERFRFFADRGIEGVFVQAENADVADMRDLEIWLTAKLLEDPGRDSRALTREFLRGYYGPAAGPIAAYLKDLARVVGRSSKPLGFAPPPGAFEWLDRYFLERAQRRFDLAEKKVAGRPELLERVRGARLALDRATLARWDLLWPKRADSRAPWSRDRVWDRYEATRLKRIEQRLTGALKDLAFESMAREWEWKRSDE